MAPNNLSHHFGGGTRTRTKSKSKSKSKSRSKSKSKSRSRSRTKNLGKKSKLIPIINHNGETVGNLYEGFINNLLNIENTIRLTSNGGKNMENITVETLRKNFKIYRNIAGNTIAKHNGVDLLTFKEIEKKLVKLFAKSDVAAGKHKRKSRGTHKRKSKGKGTHKRKSKGTRKRGGASSASRTQGMNRRQEECTKFQMFLASVTVILMLMGVNVWLGGWNTLNGQLIAQIFGREGDLANMAGAQGFHALRGLQATIRTNDWTFWNSTWANITGFWSACGCDMTAQWLIDFSRGDTEGAEARGYRPMQLTRNIVVAMTKWWCHKMPKSLRCGQNVELSDHNSELIIGAASGSASDDAPPTTADLKAMYTQIAALQQENDALRQQQTT